MEATDGASGIVERAGYSSNSAAYEPRAMISLSSPSAPSMASATASARSASPMMPNAGSSPRSSAWARRMRAHMPWMVDIQAASTFRASSHMPSARSVSHMAGAGRNARSAAIPSTAFTTFTRMRSAWFACPSS